MEVHTHTHTARKKWTHYFWEFLMLFLAVFCGFLAEYQLEHKIEKDREKEFMKSLLFDLQKDSAFLYLNSQTGPSIVLYGDSLRWILRQRPLQGKEQKIYYYLGLFSRGLPWHYYDRTIIQLRNSGSFRLIRNSKVSNAIMDYDVLMRDVKDNMNFWIMNLVQEDLKKQDKIFNVELSAFIRQELVEKNKTWAQLNLPYPPVLLTYDEKEINEFINTITHSGSTDKYLLMCSQQAYKQNRSLDSLINKEYNLK